jgi:hypothetical protein
VLYCGDNRFSNEYKKYLISYFKIKKKKIIL